MNIEKKNLGTHLKTASGRALDFTKNGTNGAMFLLLMFLMLVIKNKYLVK